MTKTKLFLLNFLLLILFANCSQEPKELIPTLDLDKKYKTNSIKLQDIAKVEYIPIETIKGKPFNGDVCVVTDDIIILRCYATNEIFIFNRQGKFINSFKKQGKGPEEHGALCKIYYNSNDKEILIMDKWRNNFKIYDLKGNFKRKFYYPKGDFSDAILFNEDLILHRFVVKDKFDYDFVAVSSIDGYIKTDLGPKIKNRVQNFFFDKTIKKLYALYYNSVLINSKGIYLNSLSNDTIYNYNYQNKLEPIILKRTRMKNHKAPKIGFLYADSRDYLFIKKTTISKKELGKADKGIINYAFNKQTKQITESVLYNADYKSIKNIELGIKMQCGSYAKLTPTIDLIDANENGELNTKLSKIASKLHENDNPVIMITTMK
jgi:hypothetical protein